MQTPENNPFYANWEFWTAITALVALVLSQLPPIYLLIKQAKLDLELFSRIHLTHKVGNPNVQIQIVLTNVGGRSVRIKGAKLTLKRDGQEVAVMPAQNFLQNPSDNKTNVLFTSFTLKPEGEWSKIVNFLNYFSREVNKKYKSAESNLRADIVVKRNVPENKDKLVEAENVNVTPFIEMFDENFIWKPGDYEAKIEINAIPEKASVQRKYRFTLFESDVHDLMKSKEDYKYGDGINWDSGKHPGVVVQILDV
jgi:hypothetical protein